MPKTDRVVWELAGYAMWLIGSALFAIVSYRNDDTLSFIGSLLFFFGIIAIMVPMASHYRENSAKRTARTNSN